MGQGRDGRTGKGGDSKVEANEKLRTVKVKLLSCSLHDEQQQTKQQSGKNVLLCFNKQTSYLVIYLNIL
jgi:hypothetical protein